MKQQKLKNWIFFILILGIWIYFFRFDYYDKYGKQFNSERVKRGILEIPENWTPTYNGTQTKLWKSEDIDKVIKGRLGKEVLINKDKEIYIERDRIINKSKGKHVGLEVSYEFDVEPNFSYRYFEVEGNSLVNNRKLSKKEFDEIIRGWEIKLN